MSKKMQWPVTIEEVDNGYQVQVGCMKLVFESQENLLTELMAYMNGKKTLLSEELKKLRQSEECEPSSECRVNRQ